MKIKTDHQPEPFEKTESTATKNRTFETLSNQRRRLVLRYLRQTKDDGPVFLRDLSEQVAAWENHISHNDVTYKLRKRVYTSLYQSHLPRLHRYGFIEYDADRGTIELTKKADELDLYLEVVPPGHLPWSDVYLGTSIVIASLVAALYLAPIPYLSSWHALVFSVIVFLSISLFHSYETRVNKLYRP